jgi:very-short-patch-repair endonuclease
MAKRAPGELWSRLRPVIRKARGQPTQAEDVLCQALRRRDVAGFKFRRQHAVERYVVDFYCARARLVIEVDGPIHDFSKEDDATRQQSLEDLSLRVLRFRNDEVLMYLDDVLQEIEVALKTSPPAAATPSPQRGEGDRRAEQGGSNDA